jgi:hypothetical protein
MDLEFYQTLFISTVPFCYYAFLIENIEKKKLPVPLCLPGSRQASYNIIVIICVFFITSAAELLSECPSIQLILFFSIV